MQAIPSENDSYQYRFKVKLNKALFIGNDITPYFIEANQYSINELLKLNTVCLWV